jgi:arylsulfatase A-like enzyme
MIKEFTRVLLNATSSSGVAISRTIGKVREIICHLGSRIRQRSNDHLPHNGRSNFGGLPTCGPTSPKWLIAALLMLTPGVTGSAAAAAVNNVVLIILDDQNIWPTADGRPGDLYPGTVTTPNLDGLINRGHWFKNTFAPVALCSPSRAAFLTGQTPFETHVFNNDSPWQSLVNPAQTLPAVMKSAGFKVGVFGKVFHQFPDSSFRAAVSDEFSMNWANWSNDYGYPYDAGPGPFTDSQHGDYINTSSAISFIARHKTTPFFLALGIFKPHQPWVVPQAYFDKYPLAGVVLPKSVEGDLADIPSFIMSQMVAWSHRLFENCRSTDDCWRKTVQGYLASTSFADAMVGRLLQALTANGLNGNTAIVVIGDNGYHLGEKTVLHKFTLWDEDARVPMIIVDPTHPGPRTVGGVAQLTDIYPTIMDLVGLPTPSWVTANSLMPQLVNNQTPTSGVSVTSRFDSLLVRNQRYAYIRYPNGTEELYDTIQDPYELQNQPNLSVKASLAGFAAQYAAQHSLFLSHMDGETINGSAGRDILSGGHRVTLIGGAGNDDYFAHVANVIVKESSGASIDTVFTDVSYTLPPNVENLVTDGPPGLTLTGNGLPNRIEAKNARMTVYDGAGLDTLVSETGQANHFVLSPLDNAVDQIFAFDGPAGAKVDLRLFSASQTCSFSNGLLTVNGEAVAKISGSFVLSRDIVNGC